MKKENLTAIATPVETMEKIEEAFNEDKTLYRRLCKSGDEMIMTYNNGNECWLQGGEAMEILLNKIETGKRKWDKNNYTIKKFLYLGVESVVRNELKRKEIVNTERYDDNANYYTDKITEYNITEKANNPAEVKDEEIECKNDYRSTDMVKFECILENILLEKGDEDCIELYTNHKNKKYSINKNKEIAEVLGWTIPKAENVKKRFFRIGEKAKKKYFGDKKMKEHG